MRQKLLLSTAVLIVALPLAGCNEKSTIAAGDDFGPTPKLVEPNKTLIPTINMSKAVGWPPGAKPKAAEGMVVNAFATGLDHPRTVYVLPNGDVLVAESNAPPNEAASFSIKGWVQGLVMKRAGAKTPSANRITLLRDADGDGVAETKTAFLENLASPFGMVLVGDEFFVANADAS
jgi:glucose/arabinose dehydrogenase